MRLFIRTVSGLSD